MILYPFIVDLGGYYKWCCDQQPNFTLKILSTYLCGMIIIIITTLCIL